MTSYLPNQYKIYTRHKVFDLKGMEIGTVDFDLKSESAGTQKFLAIAGPIVNSLLNGYPIIIDELDAKLHFLLVHFLVKLYCNEKLSAYGGQIAFSNHMLDIMDRELLRRDQIVLVSKNNLGTQVATAHSLGFRSDAIFRREYLSNQYGKIPDISLNQTELFEGFI